MSNLPEKTYTTLDTDGKRFYPPLEPCVVEDMHYGTKDKHILKEDKAESLYHIRQLMKNLVSQVSIMNSILKDISEKL